MEEETHEPMSLAALPWVQQWITSVQPKLGASFTITPDGGLQVDENADQGGFNNAASWLWTARDRSGMVTRMVNRLLGELILGYSAKFGVTWMEAIEAMGLNNGDRTMKTLQKFTRIVERLSPEVLCLEGLTHSHFDAATSFAGPTEPDQLRQWNLRIAQILHNAAGSPADRPSRWVTEKIRELQKEFGIEPSRNPGGKAVLDKYAQICYALEHWTPDQFEESGHERQKFLDYRDQIENDLINREILVIPDPKNFVPPWQPRATPAPVMEADVISEPSTVTTEEPDVMTGEVELDDDLPSLE